MTLIELGLIVACPSIGMMMGVLVWGALADAYGERVVIGVGLGSSGLVLGLAGVVQGAPLGVLLVLAGAAGSAVYAASGRLVVGWFEPGRRGTAMGIRQASQPLGVAVAAVLLPWLADEWGWRIALMASGALCIVVAATTALLLADSPRTVSTGKASTPSPYARRSRLWSIHGVAALLVAGQLTVAAFAFDYLVRELDWSPTTAGPVLAVAQLVGGAGRIAAGRWSDRVGDAYRSLRQLALANAVALGVLGCTAWLSELLSPWVLVVTVVVTVSWHGVGYAAVADVVDSSWSGRAVSVHTIAQNAAASATPPLMGALIAGAGYSAGFGAAALFPLVAAILMQGQAAPMGRSRTIAATAIGHGTGRLRSALRDSSFRRS